MSNTASSLVESPKGGTHASASRSSVVEDEPPFCLEDYVQLACSLRKSVRIDATSVGGETAQVIIYHGELWSVVDDHGGGSSAFKRMLGRPCVAHIEQLSEADRSPRTVFCNWQQFVLLAAMDDASPAANLTSGIRLKEAALGLVAGGDSTPNLATVASAQAVHQAQLLSGSKHTPLARKLWLAMGCRVIALKSRVLDSASRPARLGLPRLPSLPNVTRAARQALCEVKTMLQKVQSPPERRQALFAAGVCVCLAVLWASFIHGEFKQQTVGPTASAVDH